MFWPEGGSRRAQAALAALTALLVLAYAGGMNGSFHSDDYVLIQLNPDIRDTANYLDFLPPDYRQVLHLSYALNHAWGGLAPGGYHWVNLGLHLLATLLVFSIILRTLGHAAAWSSRRRLTAALTGAALFGLHPVQTETVVYISGRSSGLSALFCLLTLWLFLTACETRRTPGQRAAAATLALAAWGLAVLSKETAAILPAGLLLYDYCFMRGPEWVPRASRWRRVYGPAVILGILLLAGSASLRLQARLVLAGLDPALALKQVNVLAHAFRLALFPVNLTFDYDFPPEFFQAGPTFLAVVLLTGLGLLALREDSRGPAVIRFGLGWFFLTLLPTNSVLPRMDLLSERNLYLPLFGLCFLAGVLASAIAESRIVPRRRLAWLGTAAVLVCFTTGILHRIPVYDNDIALWRDTVKQSPRKVEVQYYLSMAYQLSGDYENAYREMNRLVRDHPDLLAQLTGSGEPDALRRYQQLLAGLSEAMRSDSPGTDIYRAIYDELRSLASPHPDLYYTRIIQAQNSARAGHLERAERDFRTAIEAHPDRPDGHLNLGILYAGRQRYLPAREALRRAEATAGRDSFLYPDILLNLAKVNFDLGDYVLAEARLQQFLKLRGATPEARGLAERLAQRAGRREDAAS